MPHALLADASKRIPALTWGGLMRFKTLIIAGALSLAAFTTTARAETMITGFGGANFGGDTEDTHSSFGLGIGFLGGGVFGFEAMLDYSPDFFEDPFTDDSNLTTLMGNLVLSAPIQRSRLYASGGAGLMRSRLGDAEDLFDDISENDLGVNVGGGIIGYVNDNIGLRADLRYFRNVTAEDPDDDEFDVDLGDFNYWRAAAGLTVKF
jgi:hypothetical protein